MGRRAISSFVALALVLTACASEDAAETTDTSLATTSTEAATTTLGSKGTPVIVETDVAAEGLMSIVYLVGQEDIDIRAITVSGTGLVHCEEGVDQVLGILELMEAEEVPVACGPESPIEGFNAFPGSWRAVADEGYGLQLPHEGAPSDVSAPDLIAEVISASADPVVVYADGPQTNLAQALRDHPEIVDNLEMAYIMGGALDVFGNTIKNSDAEWNIWVDPVAADEVFGSGIPITLVPLDATNQVPLSIFHREALRSHQGTPGAEAVLTMMDNSDQLEAGGLFFWDQLTAAILIDDTYATMAEQNIAVVLDEDRAVAGVTEENPNGASVRVAVTVDKERFETEFLSAIAGTDIGPIAAEPDWWVGFDGEVWTTDLPGSLEPGEYVLRLTNQSDDEAGIGFGWLTGEATVEDIDAWEGISQPPWYELESFVYITPGSDFFGVVSLTSSEEYLLVGIDATDYEASRIAVIEVGSSD